MFYFTRSVLRRAALAGGIFLTLACNHAFAGAQANADKEIASQAAEEPFKLHFALSVGGDSEFVFRGVDILPEVNINVFKALTEAVNAVPGFREFLATNGLTPKQFVALTAAPRKPIEVSRENGLYYVDGNVSAPLPFKTTVTLGAFYGTQSAGRVDHNFFGDKPIFDAYREFDSYLTFARAFGPVNVSLGGTFYHVVNNTDSDTAELNFGVTYTPRQFPYVSASFSYAYTAAFNLSDFEPTGEFLDGHYLELRIDGNVPVPYTRNAVKFQPYILFSAGSGILARTVNLTNLPTYANTERYARGSQAYVDAVFQGLINGQGPSGSSVSTSVGAIDPTTLDRSFDLSNFQAGFRIPFYLTRYITIRGDFNYSRPLGNLEGDPYNQKDQLWGGGTVTLSF